MLFAFPHYNMLSVSVFSRTLCRVFPRIMLAMSVDVSVNDSFPLLAQ